MKLKREFNRLHIAGRRWLAARTRRRERDFVVTVPPPLAASVERNVTSARHAGEPVLPSAAHASFAPSSR